MTRSADNGQKVQDAAVEAARAAMEGLDVLVAHGSDHTLKALVAAVQRRHTVLCTCGTVAEVLETAEQNKPDLIVTGVVFPDGDGIDAVLRIGQEEPVPTVVVAERRSLSLVEKAMRDHVMAYLIEPIDPVDLEAAIVVAQARFEQFRVLASEVDSLRQALDDRKVIERAKGAIMADRHIEEQEAFAMLRSRAQNARMKMVDLAHGVLEHGPEYAPKPTNNSNHAAKGVEGEPV
ncbi:MAG: ANTAR domain-containing response regulator [Phycisphaerales bacterium JB064]